MTDTDDAIIEIERGEPVVILFPDQLENQCGTLLIPNTLSIIKNGPNPNRAQQIIKRLLKADIESQLATANSAQLPLASDIDPAQHSAVMAKWLSVKTRDENGTFKLPKFKTMSVDFGAAAESWDRHKQALGKLTGE